MLTGDIDAAAELDAGEDASVLVEDASTPVEDASAPVVDSGAPLVDSGSPPVDSGPPRVCTTAADCDDGVACTTDTCDPAGAGGLGACVHAGTDADGDGVLALGCLGGTDCNDSNAAIRPGAGDVCDGIDNDCSGVVDDGPGLACALGSAPMACTTPCGTAGARACTASCTRAACVAATETCGNGCDDDGDGLADEGCPTGGPPVHDNCMGAIVLSGASGTRSDTLVAATPLVSDCAPGGVDVFYRVDLTARSIVYLSTLGSSVDTAISYRGTGCPGSATLASNCAQDACGTVQTHYAKVLAAGTHYFGVHTASGATPTGPFTLAWQVLPAAAGDNVEITGNGTYSGSTVGGPAGLLSPSCGGTSSTEDAFYWLQCPGVSRRVTADTCNFYTSSGYDTVLHVRGASGQIACNDDDSSCNTFSTDFSRVSGTTAGAGVFMIVVDGRGSSETGSYRLTVSGL